MVALLIGRAFRIGSRRSPAVEASAALVAGLICGVVATLLDFGGWGEADWRAGVFALVGSFAAIGAARISTAPQQ